MPIRSDIGDEQSVYITILIRLSGHRAEKSLVDTRGLLVHRHESQQRQVVEK